MEKSKVKERLLDYIKFKGYNINQFEKSIGASKSYMRNVKNISAEVLSDICKLYDDINPEWLLSGDGDMIKSGNYATAHGNSSVAAINSQVNTADGQLVQSLKKEIELKDKMLAEKERLIQVLMEGRK